MEDQYIDPPDEEVEKGIDEDTDDEFNIYSRYYLQPSHPFFYDCKQVYKTLTK